MSTRHARSLSLLPALALLTALASSGRVLAQQGPIGFEHLPSLVSVSSPRVSPDGRSIAIVVARPDYEENRYERQLVLVDVASGDTRELTFDRPRVGAPRWSPDGRHLAFLAHDEREEKAAPQVFALALAGGEARRLTDATGGVSLYEWAADGASVIYVAELEPAPELDGPQQHNKSFVVTHDNFLADESAPTQQVWSVSLAGGEPRHLAGGEMVVATSPREHLAVSPAGDAIAFSAQPLGRQGDQHALRMQVVDLASGAPRDFGQEMRTVGWAAFSPDGSKIASSRATHGPAMYTAHDIFVTNAAGGSGRNLTSGVEGTLRGAVWTHDGQALLVSIAEGARQVLWRVALDGAATRIDLGALELSSGYGAPELDVAPGGGLAFVARESQRPTELYWLDEVGAAPRRLTHYNDSIAALNLGRVEELRWEGPDGFAGNGILTYPPDFDPAGSYPLVLKIHGGPMSATTQRFDVIAQLMAARGFVVFGPNYRGSTNLGRAYQAAIVGDPGAGPARDVMAGLDAVLELGFVDEERLGVSGWSYGGYMTSWLIGNEPERWRAAMAGAPVTNYVDQYVLSDINTGFGNGFLQQPWSPEGQAAWRAGSPITHIHRATTPTLILCNTGDRRVPITQSYALYHALDDLDVPVSFVAYPIDGHFPADPVHREDVYRRWIEWMEQRFAVPRDAPVGG